MTTKVDKWTVKVYSKPEADKFYLQSSSSFIDELIAGGWCEHINHFDGTENVKEYLKSHYELIPGDSQKKFLCTMTLRGKVSFEEVVDRYHLLLKLWYDILLYHPFNFEEEIQESLLNIRCFCEITYEEEERTINDPIPP